MSALENFLRGLAGLSGDAGTGVSPEVQVAAAVRKVSTQTGAEKLKAEQERRRQARNR